MRFLCATTTPWLSDDFIWSTRLLFKSTTIQNDTRKYVSGRIAEAMQAINWNWYSEYNLKLTMEKPALKIDTSERGNSNGYEASSKKKLAVLFQEFFMLFLQFKDFLSKNSGQSYLERKRALTILLSRLWHELD